MASSDSFIASLEPFVLDGKWHAIVEGEYSGYLFCQPHCVRNDHIEPALGNY